MKINVYNDTLEEIKVEIGDVIIFKQPEGEIYQYFFVNREYCGYKDIKYKLTDLEKGVVAISYNSMEELLKDIISPINGWMLHEVIKSDELELRRI